jgi:type VI secretion system ImpM family protein
MVGCFGKLPHVADFVAHNAGGPAALAFEEWLRKAVAVAHERLASRWESLFLAMPPHRFLYWNDPADGAVIGTFAPSRDRSGRLFPFAVFACLPADGAGDRTGLPSAFAPFLDAAARAAGAVGPAADVAQAVEALRGDLPADPHRSPDGAGGAGAGRTVGDFAAALGADAGIAARVATNLVGLAPRFAPRAGSAPGLTLRLPLPAAAAEHRAAVAFWLDLTRRVLGVAAGVPALFWSAPAPGAHLDLSFRAPAPVAFLHLVDTGLSSEALYPLDEEGPPPERLACDAAARAWLERLAQPATRLADALASTPPPRVA